jgi:uncharacterized protein HemX
MTRTPPFGTQATRLHAGRILLVLALLVGVGVAAWVWIFHKGQGEHRRHREQHCARLDRLPAAL